MSALRAEVQWFAEEMEAKLCANDHKGHWRDCTLDYLRIRLREERQELLDLLNEIRFESSTQLPTREQAARIAREAADVANFCMMIADVCRIRAEKGSF